LLTDTEKRVPGCLCQWEAGDSPCPVHGEEETNCEHGDHPAPHRMRFCSDACARCEHESEGENGCDGICLASKTDPQLRGMLGVTQ
jgi:hypothetical protein